jgi:hypothetical protein
MSHRTLRLRCAATPWLAPAALSLLAICAMLAHGPIAQLENYHAFADQRTLLGIAHGADVLSNLGFALVGLAGLLGVGRIQAGVAARPGRAGYTLFFGALVLTAFGSSWYHLAPDNARLVFDRLPIALACAGLLSAVCAQTIGGERTLTPLLAAAAVASVLWWRVTDLHGAGDLRPYLLLQLLPLVLIPLMQWQAGRARRERLAFGAAIALYALAKACELADHALYHALGALSGHTIKHLLATLAGLALLAAWQAGAPAEAKKRAADLAG